MANILMFPVRYIRSGVDKGPALAEDVLRTEVLGNIGLHPTVVTFRA
jgi:hypothetical protein